MCVRLLIVVSFCWCWRWWATTAQLVEVDFYDQTCSFVDLQEYYLLGVCTFVSFDGSSVFATLSGKTLTVMTYGNSICSGQPSYASVLAEGICSSTTGFLKYVGIASTAYMLGNSFLDSNCETRVCGTTPWLFQCASFGVGFTRSVTFNESGFVINEYFSSNCSGMAVLSVSFPSLNVCVSSSLGNYTLSNPPAVSSTATSASTMSSSSGTVRSSSCVTVPSFFIGMVTVAFGLFHRPLCA